VIQGCRVVYESEAVSLEDSRQTPRDEFRCRVRIGVRATSMIPYIVGRLLRSRKLVYLWQMLSHKILRWWLWFILLLMFGTSAVLAVFSPFYAALFGLQAVCYSAAGIGLWAACRGRSIPLLSTTSFFLLGNAAMCAGAVKALFGKRMPAWEPIRDPAACSSATGHGGDSRGDRVVELPPEPLQPHGRQARMDEDC
jgi:hypothetical protein